mgnify:CR=1 FL=1
MIRAISYRVGGDETVETDPELAISQWQSQDNHVLWLNVQGKEVEDTNILKKLFSPNKLSVSDSLRDRHPPKYEIFPGYEYILLRTIHSTKNGKSLKFEQLSVFVGKRFIVTRSINDTGNKVLSDIWEDYKNNKFDFARAENNISYKIFRKVADDYINCILDIEDSLELIEDALNSDDKDTYLPDLTTYNTSLRKIVRNLEYLEKVAGKYSANEKQGSNDQLAHELIDVYEQAERGLSLSRMYQGLCNDLINAYISITSHRVNKIVKPLTIVTVLFLPLSFIAGLYGMNFEFMPELKLHYGYFYALGVMLVVEIVLIIILRKLKWF